MIRPNNRNYTCFFYSLEDSDFQYTKGLNIFSMEFLHLYTDRVFLFVVVSITSLVSMFLWFCYVYLKLGLLIIWKLEESTVFFCVPLEEGTSDPNDNGMEEKLLKIEKPMVWSSQPLHLAHGCV